jgi:uncharacterized protein YigE (DUF2233 family)
MNASGAMWNSTATTPAMTMRRWASAVLAALVAGPAAAVTCRQTEFEGKGYAVCEVRAGEDLRLWLNGPDGRPLGTFEQVQELLAAEGRHLVFAMNAGMYHPDRSPVGLYIEDGRETAGIVTGSSSGNFGMRPNGVFCVSDRGFSVIESRAFAAAPPGCRHATQSGPMLVIDGALHPRFLPESDSLYTRNGVGVAPDGQRAFFAISGEPVNFHDFALLFRDGLGAPNALFLDGSISRLYAPELGRDDFGFPMGPIVGMVAPVTKANN